MRALLAVFEAGLAQGFAFVYCDVYPRAVVGKRIMTENLAQVGWGFAWFCFLFCREGCVSTTLMDFSALGSLLNIC